MKKTIRAFFFSIFLCVLFLPGCSLSKPSDEVKDKYGNYNEIVYNDSCSNGIIDFDKLRNDEDYFSFELSEDGKYYIITGMSKIGQAVMDVYQSKLMSNIMYFSKTIPNSLTSPNLPFELHLPSSHLDLPVKELAENALASLDYYSYHLYIPETITRFGTNCIRQNRKILKGTSIGSFTKSKSIYQLPPALITWYVGEEELYLEPYAVVLQDKCDGYESSEIVLSQNNSKYCYEDSILYSKDKTIVYFGFDFSIWTMVTYEHGVTPYGEDDRKFNFYFKTYQVSVSYTIPNTIKEIKQGFFLISKKTHYDSYNATETTVELDDTTNMFIYNIYIPASLKKISVDFFEYVNYFIVKQLSYATLWNKRCKAAFQVGSEEYNETYNKFIDQKDLGPSIIHIDENNKYFEWVDGVLFNKEKTIQYAAFINSSKANYDIPESVEQVSGLFYFQSDYSGVTDVKEIHVTGRLQFMSNLLIKVKTTYIINYNIDELYEKADKIVTPQVPTIVWGYNYSAYYNLEFQYADTHGDWEYLIFELLKDVDLQKQQNILFVNKDKTEKVSKII